MFTAATKLRLRSQHLKFVLRCFAAFALALALAPSLFAAPPASEIANLETIIKNLGTLKDASFIRNGSSYDAKSAVKFLMSKLERHQKNISTATEFIEIHASKSSSGVPYVIRFKDGHEVKCADYLKQELHKLADKEKPAPAAGR